MVVMVGFTVVGSGITEAFATRCPATPKFYEATHSFGAVYGGLRNFAVNVRHQEAVARRRWRQYDSCGGGAASAEERCNEMDQAG